MSLTMACVQGTRTTCFGAAFTVHRLVNDVNNSRVWCIVHNKFQEKKKNTCVHVSWGASLFHAEMRAMLNSLLLGSVERQNFVQGDGGGMSERAATKIKTHTPDSSAIKIIGLFRRCMRRSGARCERCISKLVRGDTNNAANVKRVALGLLCHLSQRPAVKMRRSDKKHWEEKEVC